MKKILYFFIGISIISCKDFKEGYKDGSTNAKAEAIKAKVTLYVLDGGSVQANKLELFSESGDYATKYNCNHKIQEY